MRDLDEIERRIGLAQDAVTQAQDDLNDALITGADTVVPREILKKANVLLSRAISEREKLLRKIERSKQIDIQARAKKILQAAESELTGFINHFDTGDSLNVTHP